MIAPPPVLRRRGLVAATLPLLLVVTARAQRFERVSVDTNGGDANNYSSFAHASADGRFVVFTSLASDLVAGDTNGTFDVFVRDRRSGSTVRVSVDSAGQQGNGTSTNGELSPNGRYVVYSSLASNLSAKDTNGVDDVFVRDRDPDGNGIYDEGNGTTARVSLGDQGQQGDLDSGYFPVMSADARHVVFTSRATNLVPGDTNQQYDIFARDRDPDGNGIYDEANSTTVRLSIGPGGVQSNQASNFPAVTPDGRFVAFTSYASNLVPGDTNGFGDVFVRDRDPDGNGVFDEGNGVTVLLSWDPSGLPADNTNLLPTLSRDGRHVAWIGWASNLVAGDTNQTADVFVRDRDPDGNGIYDEGNGVTVRVSVDDSGAEGQGQSGMPVISADGRFVAFTSVAANFAANDLNMDWDVYRHDRDPDENGVLDEGNGRTTLVSVATNGFAAGRFSSPGGISAHGSLVSFTSQSEFLVPGDRNGVQDAFVSAPALTLEARPVVVTTGQLLQLDTWTGLPGTPTLLLVVAVDGVRFLHPAGLAPFDAAGIASRSFTAPAALAGRCLTFQAIGLPASGPLALSSGAVVEFR